MKVIKTIANLGIEAELVGVESRLSNGLPQTVIVGMASKQISESKDRLRTAFIAQGFVWPRRKVTINLLPSSHPKKDPSIDLAIAVSVILASSQLADSKPLPLDRTAFLGEIALDGSVKPVNHLVGKLLEALGQNLYAVVVPADQAVLAKQIVGQAICIFPAKTLADLKNLKEQPLIDGRPVTDPLIDKLSIDQISGQAIAKRAITIAASGGHNILIIGPPGIGKTLLARSLSELLPSLSKSDAIEVSRIYEHYTDLHGKLIYSPPVRQPHQNITTVKLLGSASKLEPGELSLANKGVLILNELNEFKRDTLESLRQPLEDHSLSLSTGTDLISYPADFIFVATANPCPCGYYGSKKLCKCSVTDIKKYNHRLSGPLLDRFDIFVNLTNEAQPNRTQSDTPNLELKPLVSSSRESQITRRSQLNGRLRADNLESTCQISEEALSLLDGAVEKLDLSLRARHKIIRLSRTIADLDQSDSVTAEHMAEAIQLRPPKLLIPTG